MIALRKEKKEQMEMPVVPKAWDIEMPKGIIGFQDFNRVNLLYKEDELPLMRIRQVDGECVEFFVVEGESVFDGYKFDVKQADLEELGIKDKGEMYTLNIVKVSAGDKETVVTVNLLAPLIFNRSTSQGKQVIIENFRDYSEEELIFRKEH